jgi:hypothetical protein
MGPGSFPYAQPPVVLQMAPGGCRRWVPARVHPQPLVVIPSCCFEGSSGDPQLRIPRNHQATHLAPPGKE